MDSSLMRRSGAFLSGRPAAVALVAAVLVAAWVVAAGAASLAINNQTKPVTVKAFSGSNGSCTPQVADKVSSSATLTMACPIREGISRYPDASILGWPL
ncbi:MAG: hypothetical protein LLG93_08160 [Deltaproteobacteria bacterium]|nr:hypothetical protein [Deltaproteobacteria bacterium]